MNTLDDQTAHIMAAEAVGAWALPSPQLTLISRSENIVFRLDTAAGEPYALRIHRPGYHTLEELNAEQAWMTALADAGLSVPLPKHTPEGLGYVPVQVPGTQDLRYVGVVHWFEGLLVHPKV